MTDLEKLFAEYAYTLGHNDQHGNWEPCNIEIIREIYELGRAAGRIQGLKEAQELCRLVRDGLTATTPDTHEVWQAIRARIQELEGVRDTCELVSFVIELEPSDDASH